MSYDGATAAAPLLPSAAGEPDAPLRNRFAFVCATLASMSMTTILMGYMGYNLALMSGAQLSDVGIHVLTGSMEEPVHARVHHSILAAGWAADLLGRRGTLLLANAFLMAGALAMSAGDSDAALMATSSG